MFSLVHHLEFILILYMDCMIREKKSCLYWCKWPSFCGFSQSGLCLTSVIYITSDWIFFLHCHSNSPVRGSAVSGKAATQTSSQFPRSSVVVPHFPHAHHMDHGTVLSASTDTQGLPKDCTSRVWAAPCRAAGPSCRGHWPHRSSHKTSCL